MTEQPTCNLLGDAASFGFGDRIGMATPGHVEAMKRAGSGIQPIFPQQSIREMARTNRTPQEVMADALNGVEVAGWTGPTGADADHLKTITDVNLTAEAGFTFFTIDPSDHVDQQADNYNESVLRTKFAEVRREIDWWDQYLDKQVALPSGTKIVFDELACMRCAVKYGRAIKHAVALGHHISRLQDSANRVFEIELSVDETEQPTTLAEHFIVADQCFKNGLNLVSLAPRFLGDFEKGVDYKGNLDSLERSLKDHAAIARMLGSYKLSLHSGSDKLSIYPILAKCTTGRFHVKTAGTSYLEALRVVLRHDEPLFRRIVEFCRGYYEKDRATYHVSAKLDSVPRAQDLSGAVSLEQVYLERWCDIDAEKGFTAPGRQILHCTFGSVLTHSELGSQLHDILTTHQSTYTEILAEHFQHHLQALTVRL